MSTGRVGGGGPQIRPQQQQPAVQKKETRESKESKEAKGSEGKSGVSGGGKSGGVKAKGKAKGKDLGSVGGLIAGQDQWALEDEGDNRRRRSRQFFNEQEMADLNAVPEDFDPELSMLENIRADFRGQVAQGLAAARSWTRGGSSSRPEEATDDNNYDDDDED